MRLDPEDLEGLKPLLAAFAAEIITARPPDQPGDGRITYTEAEAAALIGLEVHVLREQRRLGRIEPCAARPGRRILYTREAITKFLAGGDCAPRDQ